MGETKPGGTSVHRPHRGAPPLFDRRFSLDSPTGARLNVFRTDARGAERGILLVSHGLAEHAGRYARFAGEMAAEGFHVFAPDHRGHGSTTARDAPLRRFAKTDGANKVVADVLAVLRGAEDAHPGLPTVMFGHSMGAHVAVNVATAAKTPFAGLAVWNADFRFGARERLAAAALKTERMLKGSDVASAVFERATFGAWARSVEPRQTGFDWLSHDAAAVERYADDPLCGWTPTVSMALDVLDLVRRGGDAAALAQLPPDLAVHVLCGTEDPATARGEAGHAFAGALRHSGHRAVDLVLADGARHETLHEAEEIRAPALRSLAAWLRRITPAL